MSDILLWCNECGGFVNFTIAPIDEGGTFEGGGDGTIYCEEEHVITRIEAAEPGQYELVRVGEPN